MTLITMMKGMLAVFGFWLLAEAFNIFIRNPNNYNQTQVITIMTILIITGITFILVSLIEEEGEK